MIKLRYMTFIAIELVYMLDIESAEYLLAFTKNLYIIHIRLQHKVSYNVGLHVHFPSW